MDTMRSHYLFGSALASAMRAGPLSSHPRSSGAWRSILESGASLRRPDEDVWAYPSDFGQRGAEGAESSKGNFSFGCALNHSS